MLRGIFNRFEISAGKIYDTQEVLQNASALHLPTCMRSACFVSYSSSIYFTIPEEPNVVYAQFVPSPLRSSRPRAFQATFDIEDGLLDISDDHAHPSGRIGDAWRDGSSKCIFRGDVLALAACDRMLFVLVRKSERDATDDSFWVHRLPTHPDSGFHVTDKATRANLTLPGGAKTSTLGFAVVSPFQSAYEVYVSGPGWLHRARFNSGQRIILEPFPERLATPGLPVTLVRDAAHDGTTESGKGDALLAADINSQSLYSIRVRSGQPSVSALGRLPDSFGSAPRLGIARLHVNVSYVEPADQRALEPQARVSNFHGSRIPLILIANSHLAQVWSINQLDKNEAPHALIGGGTKPHPYGAPKNLHDVHIGPVDTVCPLHDAGFLFGARDLDGWRALLTPTMLRTLGILEPIKQGFGPQPPPTGNLRGSS